MEFAMPARPVHYIRRHRWDAARPRNSACSPNGCAIAGTKWWKRSSRRNRHRAADPQNPSRSRQRRIQPRTELLLYFASRAQNVDQVIRPALDAGRIVLCDRFTDSTLVYQGCGRGLDSDVVRDLDRIACSGLKPDVTLLIDIDLETSLTRAKRRNERGGAGGIPHRRRERRVFTSASGRAISRWQRRSRIGL